MATIAPATLSIAPSRPLMAIAARNAMRRERDCCRMMPFFSDAATADGLHTYTYFPSHVIARAVGAIRPLRSSGREKENHLMPSLPAFAEAKFQLRAGRSKDGSAGPQFREDCGR